MTIRPVLDPLRFDTIVGVPNKLWGSREIARALGVSESTVRRWAEIPEVPIYKPAGTGRMFCYRNEIEVWLKSK